MNDLAIWKEYNDVNWIEDNKHAAHLGYVYLIEYGQHVKIGSTKRPARRMKQLNSIAVNYAGLTIGKIVISRPHTNFTENESQLHRLYGDKRVGLGIGGLFGSKAIMNRIRTFVVDAFRKEFNRLLDLKR